MLHCCKPSVALQCSVVYVPKRVQLVGLNVFVTASIPFSNLSFGICPHMTDDNKDQLKGKDLLVAYYDVDYDKNPKGSNYWRNR